MNIGEFFSDDDIARVFTVECFQKDPETFLKTHYPMTFTYKPQGSSSVERTIDEDTLLEQWKVGIEKRKKIREFIRPFIIWGAPGTGKTELCRLLEVKIPENNRQYQPIRVSKRDLIAGGILGVAQTFTGRKINIDEQLLNNWGGQTPEQMVAIALGLLKRDGKLKITASSEKENIAFKFLASQIIKNIRERVNLLKTTEDLSTIETSLQFLKKSDQVTQRNELLSQKIFVKYDLEELNNGLYKKFSRLFFNVDNVSELMIEYIKETNKKGKIPVLIFDDVTFLGDLVDDFISVITDISGSNKGSDEFFCDFIVGTTTEFYLRKFHDVMYQTAQERISEIKFSPPGEQGQNANWLMGDLGPNHFLHFISTYLNAARMQDIPRDIPNFSIFVEDGFSYFPFSKSFLISLYHRIEREKDISSTKGNKVTLTPRSVIKIVRETLLQSLETSRSPSSVIDNFLILNTLDFFQLKEDQRRKYEKLLLALWWYGSHDEGERMVTLEISTLNSLGIQDKIPKEWVSGSVFVLPEDPLIDGSSSRKGPIEPIPHVDQELRENIRRWCRGDSDVQIATNNLKKGFNTIIDVMNSNLSGDKKYTNFINRRSSRKGLESIEYIPEGSKSCDYKIGFERSERHSLVLVPDDQRMQFEERIKEESYRYILFNVDDFFDLYKLGRIRSNDPQFFNHQLRILEAHGDFLQTALTYQNDLLRNDLESELRCSMETFVLSAFIIVEHLFKTGTIVTELRKPEDVISFFSHPLSIHIQNWPQKIASQLHGPVHPGNLQEITEGLFLSFFSVRGGEFVPNIVDYPLILQTMKSMKEDPIQVIMHAQVPNERYILSKSKKTLKDYLKTLKTLIEASHSNINPDLIQKMEGIHRDLLTVGNSQTLIKSLKSLESKLSGNFVFNRREISKLIVQLEQANPSQLLDTLENVLQAFKKHPLPESPITKIKLMNLVIFTNEIYNSPEYQISTDIVRILGDIEEKIDKSTVFDLEQLRIRIKAFIDVMEVIHE